MRGSAIPALCFLVLGCTDFESAEQRSPAGAEVPNQEGWDATVVFTTEGIVDAEIHYGHMMRWDQRQVTTFRNGVKVDFFENGHHTAVLHADSGEVRGSTNDFTAVGHVVIVSDSGVSMITDKIHWENMKQRVFADGFVTMFSAEDTLYGYAFESNKDLTNWRMQNAYGQSARDIDLKTGTVRDSRRKQTADAQDRLLDEEMKEILREPK